MLEDVSRRILLKGLAWRAEMGLHVARPRPHGLPFPLIVSVTSYPPRYDTLAATLKSLLAQTVRAENIILWLTPDDIPLLPASVRRLERFGLQIRETPDTRSYKKIIPALEQFPEAGIVTADDDVYYPPHWLAMLASAWRADRREVLCHRAHRMKRMGEGFAPYQSWDFEVTDTGEAADLFATGVGGIFYPPGAFHPDVQRVDRFTALCPTTDDVWLNWMARLNGYSIRKVGPRTRFREWLGSQEVGLLNVNFMQGSNNDDQIARIVKAYGIPDSLR